MTDAALQSVRLFPKNLGSAAYSLTGIAARCDWALMSDNKEQRTYLHRTQPTERPRHIFLSLRNVFAALPAFATEILPKLTAPFVLISGSEDVTLPLQLDLRWRAYNASERQHISTILNHPLLIRWFAENLVEDGNPRFAALPTGMVYPKGATAAMTPVHIAPTGARPLRILVGHRVRSGPQWELRRAVSQLASTTWKKFCTVPEEELPEPEFLRLMQSHAFVLCAEGGGVDPSPKAWQAMLQGAIPIIRKTGTYQAYAQLPVAFVTDWQADSLTPDRLAEWHRTLAPHHDVAALRAQTLKRLGIDYWWAQIESQTRCNNL